METKTRQIKQFRIYTKLIKGEYMTDKLDTSLTISDDNVPALLRLHGDEKDPNWQDVPYRDRVKHLRERYWLKQSAPY